MDIKMEERIYRIALANGTEIGNLRLNGNNFISDTPIDAAIFEGNCSPVIINDGEKDETHENMELVQAVPVGEECWFILRDITAAELEKIKMQSDIEYVAMMAGIEI